MRKETKEIIGYNDEIGEKQKEKTLVLKQKYKWFCIIINIQKLKGDYNERINRR